MLLTLTEPVLEVIEIAPDPALALMTEFWMVTDFLAEKIPKLFIVNVLESSDKVPLAGPRRMVSALMVEPEREILPAVLTLKFPKV